MWNTATTEIFDEWFTGLDEDAKVEIDAVVRVLRLLGPRLGRPHVDHLKGSKHANLKELRARTVDQVIRIAFAFDPRQTAILLIGGDKGGVSEQRFYKQLIARADTLFDRHLEEIRKQTKKRK